MLAPCDLNFFVLHFFHGPCVKKNSYVLIKNQKKFGIFFNPYIHPSNTFHKKPKPKL